MAGIVFFIPDICHNLHNRWFYRIIQVSVKFSYGCVKETAVTLHKMCNLQKSDNQVYTNCVILYTWYNIIHKLVFYTQSVFLHT